MCVIWPVAMILTLRLCFILPGTEPDPEPEVRMTGHLECKYHEASELRNVNLFTQSKSSE